MQTCASYPFIHITLTIISCFMCRKKEKERERKRKKARKKERKRECRCVRKRDRERKEGSKERRISEQLEMKSNVKKNRQQAVTMKEREKVCWRNKDLMRERKRSFTSI